MGIWLLRLLAERESSPEGHTNVSRNLLRVLFEAIPQKGMSTPRDEDPVELRPTRPWTSRKYEERH